MINKPEKIIVHHTGGTDIDPLADTSNHTFEIVNEYHKGKWNFMASTGYYIGYQYFIEKSGKVIQGRADEDEGAHTIGENLRSIGICMAGNFDLTLPTTEQTEALRGLMAQICLKYGITKENIFPHRHFAHKTCYGDKLSDSWASDLICEACWHKVEEPMAFKQIEETEVKSTETVEPEKYVTPLVTWDFYKKVLSESSDDEITLNKDMDKIKTVFTFLEGKKTYIVAIVGLIYGILSKDAHIIEVSILAMTGRGAISKLEK